MPQDYLKYPSYTPETRSALGQSQYNSTAAPSAPSAMPSNTPLSYGNNANYPSYGMENNAPSGGGGLDYMSMAGAGLDGLQNMTDSAGPQAPQMSPEGMPMQAPEMGTSGKIGGGLDAAGNVAMASGNPYAMAAGGAAKLAGMGLSLYDKNNQRKEAKKNFRKMMDEYERRQAVEREDRAMEKRRLERKEGYFGADYARNLGTELAGQYQGYRQGGQ